MTTLDEFMAIKPNAYMAVVDSWRPRTAALKSNYDDYKRWATTPNGTYWSGRFATASQERAADDCKSTDNADDTTEDIVKLAGATIEYEVLPPLTSGQNLVERVLQNADQGVSIDQSFTMSYTPPEGMSEETAAKNREHVKDTERQIKNYVATWEKATQTLKTQTDAARETMLSRINPKAALVDGRKILRDAAQPKPGEQNATTIDYKQQYPKATDPASTTPAAAGSPDTINYKELYPKTTVDGHQLGALGAMPGVREGDPAKPAKLAPTLADRDVPAFKAMMRETLRNDRVPADQIEQRVNDAVKAAQAPRFMPDADPMRTPGQVPLHNSPGDQFNDIMGRASDSATKTVDGQIEQAKILTGQAGPGAPGVAEAWRDVGINAARQAHELTTDPLAAPKMGIQEAKDFYNHPGESIGKNIILGTEALAGGAVGGEAAAGARGLLGDLTGTEGRALTHGIDSSHPGPTVEHNAGGGGGSGDAHSGGVGDHGGGPGGHGMPGGNPTSFDFDNPLQTARPEFNVPHPVDVMSPELRGLAEQHLTGSGETVLGPYAPQTGGPSYIEVAGERGASYFDIGDAWNTSTPTQQLAANQHVLDTAISNRDTIKLSVPFDEIRPDTYTGAELRYIEKHGYVRVDDTTYIPPGGQR